MIISSELNALLDLFVKEFLESVKNEVDYRPHVGSVVDLDSFDELINVKENFTRAIEEKNMQYVREVIFKTGRNRLINSVSNKIKLQTCIRDCNTDENLLNLCKLLQSTMERLNQTVNDDNWENEIIKHKFHFKNHPSVKMNNNIDAFIREFFYAYNIKDNKYPLWNGCIENAQKIIREIENKSEEAISKLDFMKFFNEEIKRRISGKELIYPSYYITDKFFNLLDKIKDNNINDKTNNGTELKKLYRMALDYRSNLKLL